MTEISLIVTLNNQFKLKLPNPLWHLELQYEALRTKASVESMFGLLFGIQNQKYAKVIPKWAELAEKTYELSCVKL